MRTFSGGVAIVACLVTWLAGHPLLVAEFAFLFWVYCGVLASIGSEPPAARRHNRASTAENPELMKSVR